MERAASDGIKLEGFIEIEIVNKKEHTKKVFKNTITKGGKQFMLAHSAGTMMATSASLRGNAMINSGLINRAESNYKCAATYDQQYCLTNLLCHLDTLQTGLTETSTFVNLFDSTGIIDVAKVVGYANNNITPTANGREGSIDYCKDEYVADGYTVCERWKYPEGVATGTIDTILMAPAGWKVGKGLGGQRFSKCLDKVNTQLATYSAKTTRVCPPGIAGFTSNDEILLNYTQDSISQHKHSISTGVITNSPTTWFVFPVGTISVVKIGDYIYSLDYQRVVTVWLASTMTQVTAFATNFSVGNSTNLKLFVDASNNLWITAMSPSTNTTTGTILAQCSKSGLYFNAVSNYYADWTKIVTKPSALGIYDIGFGMLGSNYIMYVRQNNYDSLYNDVYTGIVFTNTADILGSIIDIIPELYNTSLVYYAGTSYGVIDVGFPVNSFSIIDSENKARNIINNTGTKAVDCTNGCYLSLKGWYTTLMSFVKLTTPVVKSDTDIMYVSYGYKVV